MSSSFSIFHFTHIDNINNIVKSGIIANSFIDTNNYRNVGDLDIKEKRKRMYLTIRDKRYYISDFVPFYFAPLSPMLYTQYRSNKINQEDIIYIICGDMNLISSKYFCLCSNINAACSDAIFETDPKNFENHIDKELMFRKYWSNTEEDPNRMQRRMAEFLVYKRLSYDDISFFAVYNQETKDKLLELGVDKDIYVRRDFYFS